jgi:hypothetical protein
MLRTTLSLVADGMGIVMPESMAKHARDSVSVPEAASSSALSRAASYGPGTGLATANWCPYN